MKDDLLEQLVRTALSFQTEKFKSYGLVYGGALFKVKYLYIKCYWCYRYICNGNMWPADGNRFMDIILLSALRSKTVS